MTENDKTLVRRDIRINYVSKYYASTSRVIVNVRFYKSLWDLLVLIYKVAVDV